MKGMKYMDHLKEYRQSTWAYRGKSKGEGRITCVRASQINNLRRSYHGWGRRAEKCFKLQAR